MTKEKKAFFREREAKEIRELKVSETSKQRGIVRKINKLGENEALIVRAQIIPGEAFQHTDLSYEAARHYYKYGDLISLSQPESLEEALKCKEIPLAIRNRDFEKYKDVPEEELNFFGYSWRPVQGRDRRKRIVPFSWLPEGIRLFGFAEANQPYKDKQGNLKMGIETELKYSSADRIQTTGAQVVCEVPSRTRRKQKYSIKLNHVPVDNGTGKRAIIWSLAPSLVFGEDGEPISGRVEHDTWRLKYGLGNTRTQADEVVFYPHDIAAYIAIAGNFWKQHNLTPMEMNPFALTSKQGVEFYKKLRNNVLIFDPKSSAKDKLRKPYVAEQCILWGRAICKLGINDFAYWDPTRDGKLKDYDWSVGK